MLKNVFVGQKVKIQTLSESDTDFNPDAKEGDIGIIIHIYRYSDTKRCWVYIPKKRNIYSLDLSNLESMGRYSSRHIYTLINQLEIEYSNEPPILKMIVNNLHKAEAVFRKVERRSAY